MSKSGINLDLKLNKGRSETFVLPNKTQKLISRMLKDELYLNFKKFISPYIINKNQRKYLKQYLQDISKVLISLSHKKKGISKYIFTEYFELPGLISSRLFTVFNNNENEEEYLASENFIKNMMDLFSGNFNELSNIIFKLFDFKNDGNITSDEISIILSYIPISHQNYDDKKFKFEQDEFIDRIQSQEEIALSLKILFANKKSISYNEFVDIVKKKNSDIFIFLLIFILERKPFTKEIIEIYQEDDYEEENEENEKNEEEEEDDDDDKQNKKDIYIIPPIIGIDKTNAPKFGKKNIVLPAINTPLKNPLVAIQNDNIFLKEVKLKDVKKENIGNGILINNIFNNNLHHSKSDENIKNINEKHKEDEHTKITFKNNDCLSEINFIKLRSSEKGLFPIKRKSRLINIKNEKNQKISHVKTVWHLKNFKLNKNFGLKKIEDSEEYEDSDSNSNSIKSSSNSEEEEEEEVENNSNKAKKKKKLELSDEEKNLNINNKKKIVKEGYLYKLSDSGKMKKLWFKLINKHLFYFKSKDSTHNGIHCLIHAFIKESYAREINDKDYYCFSLIFGKKEKEYFVDNEKDYLLWLKIFKKILHCENIKDLFEIKEKIGEGKYACVYKAKHKASERIVAIKILEKKNISTNEFNMIKNEIDILKICQHPNIVKLYDVIEDFERIHIIMELIEGPDLFCYLENKKFDINEKEANKIISKLSSALFYLNVFGIVHRDIKPENILLTDISFNYEIKLIDFGLGIILGPEEKSNEPFGTVSYASPEVLCEKEYDKSVDIWSLGILTYLLLVGRLPFDHPEDDENEIARQTINDPVPFIEKKWNHISSEAKDFVNKCLQKDPFDRMNITEILQHKWLKKYKNEEQKKIENNFESLCCHEVFKLLCPNT